MYEELCFLYFNAFFKNVIKSQIVIDNVQANFGYFPREYRYR